MRSTPTTLAPRDRLLDAATRLFCRLGINATGIDLVVSEAGVAKATLYKAFGSKERLVEAVLEREGAVWREWFFAALDAAGDDAATRLRSLFPVLKTWFERDEFFGCPFINAIGESDKTEDRLRAITLRHKRLVLDRMEKLARESRCLDPAALAHQLGLLMDGAIVAAMVTRSSAVADGAGMAAAALVDAATGKLPRWPRTPPGPQARPGRPGRAAPHPAERAAPSDTLSDPQPEGVDLLQGRKAGAVLL